MTTVLTKQKKMQSKLVLLQVQTQKATLRVLIIIKFSLQLAQLLLSDQYYTYYWHTVS